MSRNPIYKALINSTRWRKLRAEKLRSNPICEECERKDRSTIATEVHHIVPVESVSGRAGMERLMFSWLNLQSLCHACHVETHRLMFSHTKEAVRENTKRNTARFVDRYLK